MSFDCIATQGKNQAQLKANKSRKMSGYNKWAVKFSLLCKDFLFALQV